MWVNPKLDWYKAGVSNIDMQRIEGNEDYLYSGILNINRILEQLPIYNDNIDSILDQLNANTFWMHLTYLETDNIWNILESSTFDITLGFLEVISANVDSQPIIFNGEEYVSYELTGKPLSANSIQGTPENPLVSIVLFDKSSLIAWVIFSGSINFNTLTYFPYINGNQLTATNTTESIGINAVNMPNESYTLSVADEVESLLYLSIGDELITARFMNEQYIICNGQQVLKTDYPELYLVVGDRYGEADEGYFRLPSTNNTLKNAYIKAKSSLEV